MAEAQPPQDDPAAAAASAADAASAPAPAGADAGASAIPDPAAQVDAGDASAPLPDSFSIDELLKQASFDDPTKLHDGQAADGGAAAAAAAAAIAANEFKLPSFQQVMQDAQVSSIELLRDVELNVKIELGRSRMMVEDVLKLAEGSVVELDKLAGDPVDVFVNDRLVARGEVLVLNDNFCVRVNEIVAAAKEEAL
jgi:flagellar motor switch protein FliN/FliY